MIDTTQVLRSMLSAFGLFFPAWPLILLAPLQRRRHILYNMSLAWIVMGLFWLGSLFGFVRVRSWLIPDPWNATLFFAAGLGLLALHLGRAVWQRRAIQVKADRASHVDDLHALSPGEFERLVVELYSAMGHKAQRTGTAGDHGVDVEVRALSGEKWIVQCKRWRGSVGEPVVRDFYGVLHHEKADRGAVITTGHFTEQARRWAQGKPIELIEGDEFLRLLKHARSKATTPGGGRVPYS
jgi:hypothetical protein